MGRCRRRRAEHARHREHVAVRDVDDHRHAALRTGGLHLVEQRILGLPLQIFVDRQHHVGPALGVDLRALRVGDVVAERILLDGQLTRLPRQQGVVLLLDSGGPGSVGVHLPDDRGTDRTRGIAAGRLRHEANPRELQGLDRLGHGVGDRVGEIHEPSG